MKMLFLLQLPLLIGFLFGCKPQEVIQNTKECQLCPKKDSIITELKKRNALLAAANSKLERIAFESIVIKHNSIINGNKYDYDYDEITKKYAEYKKMFSNDTITLNSYISELKIVKQISDGVLKVRNFRSNDKTEFNNMLNLLEGLKKINGVNDIQKQNINAEIQRLKEFQRQTGLLELLMFDVNSYINHGNKKKALNKIYEERNKYTFDYHRNYINEKIKEFSK